MKHRLTHNLGVKLISLLVACVIWLLVVDSNDPERTQVYRNVPIIFENQDTITDAGMTYSVTNDVDKVSVYATARRSVRSKLNSSSFVVKANLENYNQVTGSVPLEFSCTDPAVSIENIRITPSALKINMEEMVEQSFAVVATVPGQAQKGYELGKTTILTGDTIKIAGPESLIQIIGRVSVVVDDIASLKESQDKSYAVRIEDKNGATMTDSQMERLELKGADGVVLQDNMVDVRIEIWQVYENIPVAVLLSGEPAEGYRVTSLAMTPDTVNLAAADGAIDKLGGSLTLEESINIDGVSESQEYRLDINDTLEDYSDIRLQADTASIVTVTLKVEEVGSKTFDVPVSQIELLNAPWEKKLIFSPADRLQINVRATEENLLKLTAEDIKVSLDLRECVFNQSYSLPVSVTLPDGYELGSEVTIVVNVEDAGNETEAEAFTGE